MASTVKDFSLLIQLPGVFIIQKIITHFINIIILNIKNNYIYGRKQGVIFPSPLKKHYPWCLKHHVYTIIQKPIMGIPLSWNISIPMWPHLLQSASIAPQPT
jgi:hypothetical protein